MKVRMMRLSAGPSGARQPGAVVDVSKSEAKALIDDHAAELVSGVLETADAVRSTEKAATVRKPQIKRR